MKGKTTGLKQKGFAVVLSVFMAFLMMFTGCNQIAGVLEEKPGEEEEESSVETSEEPVSEEEKEKEGLGKTFASKVVGNYKCEISHDEVALLSLYNIGGNIYGFVAEAMVEDGIEPESNIYSYYAIEIMPTQAGETLSSSSETIEAGFMAFSDMSNLTKYWDKPRLGTISLTNDGIKITAKNNDENPLFLYDAEMNFVKDPSLKGHFTYEAGFTSSVDKQPISEELNGLWKVEGRDSYFMEFMKGSDDSTYGFQIYEKEPGTEVNLGRGVVVKDADGIYHADYKILCSEAPVILEFTLEETDTGAIKISSDDFTHGQYGYLDGTVSLDKVEKTEVPLVTCFAIDDPKAYERNPVINAPDLTTRTLIPQVLAANEVENNGGYFVRADNFVFFRYYDNEKMPNLQGYNGNFLWDKDQRTNSYLCYYDTVTGKTGVACKDGGYGPLYYLNGKFVTEFYTVNSTYSQQYVMAYYPNGNGAEYLNEEGFLTILDISEDGKYLAWNDFNASKTQVSTGNTYLQDYDPLSYEDTIIGAKFANGNLIMLNQNGESGYLTFEMINPISEEKTNLGGFNVKDDHFGYVRLQNVIWEEGDVYAGLAWVDNYEVVSDFMVVKMDTLNPGKPEVLYDEYPECCKNGGYPYFGLNYANEVIVHTCYAGMVALTEISYGDLDWYDSFYSVNKVAENYITVNPFEAKKGDTVTVLQKAEVAGENAFVIKADASALCSVQSADFDRYNDFVWKGYTYSRISLDAINNNGKNFKEEEISFDNLDSYEAISVRQAEAVTGPEIKGPFVADNAEDAFNMVIDTYKKAIDEDWDREKSAEAGLADSVYDSIWPAGFTKDRDGGYCFVDVNKDGQDELIIQHDGSLLAIYGYNGKEAVLSYNNSYRHEAFLYEDGMIQVLFGTMDSAAEYWYRYHGLSGYILPVVEKTYTPDKDTAKNVECFVFSAELNPEEVDRNYREWGQFPVWAWEWGDEITEKEFDSYTSKAKKVKLPKAKSF